MNELPTSIRAFVAVPIPAAIRDRLASVQDELRKVLRDVSWTRPESIHLTLHFFGDVPASALGDIGNALARIARETTAISLAVRRVGHFNQRVIWAGMEGDVAALTDLANQVREGVGRWGAKQEVRPYSAHVTLGRVRVRADRRFTTELQRFSGEEFGTFVAEHLELIRSELSPRGSRYTVLHTLELSRP